ncbi:MarR family winged helix-turn-helix transcriptional regulator [Nocardia sp. CDC160]|uniref:MarR family winged helix-turn-helix transcriptional regulator n=1 Tax=Nocardia sp. CDC160 TaxID=3112166 RepID=UPI002DB568CD|nr:MarR family transcriptional regulator [Nocardia sp. CDC160]MEC3918176.1 MarR family transcriptional regulator [Nocardia sp. CDC160]
MARAHPVDKELRDRLTVVVPLISAYLRRARRDMPANMRQAFETAGLGARHGAVLSFVWSSGPVSVSEVARQLSLSLTNTSQLSGELTRAGWLRRESDPTDHRRTLLSVPPERHDEFGEFLDRRSDVLLRAMTRLTPEQRDGFLAGLNAWADEIEQSHRD